MKCSGTNIHYYRRRGVKDDSARAQSLVLIHGISDDGYCWTPFLASLDPAWDVVMPDLRGHGLSEDPDAGWNISVIADETAELVRELGLQSPLAAGASLGGAVLLALAARNPNLPAAVFLEDPVPFWNAPDPLPQDAGRGLRDWLTGLKRKTYSDLEKEAAAASWAAEERGPWIDSKHRMSPKVIPMATAKDFAPRELKSLIGGVSCPVFLMSGEIQRGAICTDEDVAALRRYVPQVKFARLPGVGHSVRRENPADYTRALLSFFRQAA